MECFIALATFKFRFFVVLFMVVEVSKIKTKLVEIKDFITNWWNLLPH